MGRLGRITLEDMATGLLRYVPAFVTAAAILTVVTLLPGKPDKSDMSGPRLRADTPLQQGASPSTTAPPPSTTRSSNAVRPEASAPPAGAATGNSGSGSSYGSASGGGGRSAGSASGGGTFDFDEEDGTGEGDDQLRIVAAAWASRTAGSPLGSQGVPEGSLPVGTRLAQDDKRSFIRLEGDAMTLTLTEDSEGTREPAQGDAAVQACAITDAGWEEQDEAYSFDDAPPYDGERCVDGERADDGTWTFNLLTLGDVASDEGLALVPGAEAPVDFQVAFEPFISPVA